MDRLTNVYVNGSYLKLDGNVAGIQGEGNVNTIRIHFSEEWKAWTKSITFSNAKGQNPVVIDIVVPQNSSSVDILIPPEALTDAGNCSFSIKGVEDGKRAYSACAHMQVLENDLAGVQAGNSVPPTPSELEQIRIEIDEIRNDIPRTHSDLSGRDLPDQHPIEAITGLKELTAHRESSQTIKQDEQIPEITSPETLRTYFYNLRKSDSRKWQFELSPGGIHENIIEALGGRPEGVPEADKAFLYIDIPYSEAGGFIIKATFEGRDKPILYKKSIFGTLDSRWQDTGWIEQKPQKKEILLVTCEQTEPDRYTVDHSSSEINDFAASGGLPVLQYKSPVDESAYSMELYTYVSGIASRFGSDAPAVFVRPRTRNDASNCPILGKFTISGRNARREDVEYRVRDDDGLSNLLLPEALISRDLYKVPIFGQDGRNGWSLLKLVDDNMRGPYTTYSSRKIEGKIVRSAFAVCYDKAAPGSFAPNKWYIPQTSPKPSMETGMMIDVLWKKGCEDGIGYDVKLIWGEPGGADNELLLDETGTTDKLTGEHGIPAEGTVRYQLVETNGRKHWEYVSGPLLQRQFSTPSAATAKNKIVPGMELAYLPGQEIFVQMDNGNTADLMWIVPDAGPTLPVYGNGTGTKTGAIPAGYILQLKNGGDHWQIINGGGTAKADVLVVQATYEGARWVADAGSETIRSFGGEVILKAEVDGVPYVYRYQRYDSTKGAVFTHSPIRADEAKQIDIIVDRNGNITRTDHIYNPFTTIRILETIAEITDLNAFRTYFHDLRKSTHRDYQAEISPDGVNQNLMQALGWPEGFPETDKAFLYITLPHSETGGFIIKTTLEGRTNGKLYRRTMWGTGNANWHDTGWQDAKGGIPKPEAVTDGQFAVFNADGTLRGETLTNRKDVGA